MFKTKSALCLILLLTASCSTGSDPAPIDPCSKFQAVYWQDGDILTPETKREILAVDKEGHELCGWPFAE